MRKSRFAADRARSRMTSLLRKAMLAAAALLMPAAESASAQQVDLSTGSVVQTVERLRPGEYVWAPEIAPEGPTLLIVNLKTQRAVLYRNGVPIGASTISTGRPGYRTPTGVFTILQKRVEHYSSTYDNAPMPYMQRLTWRGVALHAGKLPGYPASHGCIRLPLEFAKLLYGVTHLAMTVIITDHATTPRVAAPPAIAGSSGRSGSTPAERMVWQPQISPTGPISIIVSVADRRAVVLRNGVEIGSAPVSVVGLVSGSWAYTLRSVDAAGQHWIRVPLSKAAPVEQRVPREEWKRFEAPDQFKRLIAAIVEPGTTIVIALDSLREGATGSPGTIIEGQPAGSP